MEEQLHIRLATRKDVRVVLEFIRELARFEEVLHQVTTTQKQLLNTLFSKDSMAHAVLGYENKEPAAFAVYFFGFSTFQGGSMLCVDDLFVPTPHRGKGYGQDIMTYLAQIALENHCVCIEWGGLKHNTSATGFYEKLGAYVVKERLIYRLDQDAMTALAKGNPSKQT